MTEWFVKRVPETFDWPLEVVWEGYLNPWPGPVSCLACEGTGFNSPTHKLYRTYRSWAPRLTKGEEAFLVEQGVPRQEIAALRARRRSGLENPVLMLQLIELRAQRKRFFGPCDTCVGERTVPNPNPAVQQLYEGVNLYEEWKPIEPPMGEGWQLWIKPAPEGYPRSPVFKSAEDLAKWCSETFKTSYDEWLTWVRDSGVVTLRSSPTFRLPSENFKVFLTSKVLSPKPD